MAAFSRPTPHSVADEGFAQPDSLLFFCHKNVVSFEKMIKPEKARGEKTSSVTSARPWPLPVDLSRLVVGSLGMDGLHSWSQVSKSSKDDTTTAPIRTGCKKPQDFRLVVQTILASLERPVLNLSGCISKDAKNGDAVRIMILLVRMMQVNTSLTHLNLRENNFGELGGLFTAGALRVDTNSLTDLNFAVNQLGARGGVLIARALHVNKSLTALDLEGNEIVSEGGVAIADALRVNTSLKSLNLHYNFIGQAGGEALGKALAVNTSLTSLDFSFNKIGQVGGEALAEALRVNTSLTSLDTRGNNISGDSAEQLAAAVLGSRSLLKFGGIPMKELRANKLTELDLSEQGLGPSEGRLLGGLVAVNTSLTSLDARGNVLSDAIKKTLEDVAAMRRGLDLQL